MTSAPYPTREQYQAAVAQARDAASRYYQAADDGGLAMSDADYDLALERIALTETENPDWAASGGLLTDIAAGTAPTGEIRHTTPMLSLDKISYDKDRPDASTAEVRAFASTIRGSIVGEPKLDGLAANATYRKGVLLTVALRGDGTRGEDVTAQAQEIAGLPVHLSTPWTGEIRGEVYMSDADFAAASEARTAAGKPAFVNPRNAVAGSIRKVGRSYAAPMSFGAYDIVGDGIRPEMTHVEAMKTAAHLGFGTALSLMPDTAPALHADADSLLASIDALRAARPALGYGIDGYVIKANEPADRNRLGAGTRTPRWATAYKYAPEEATTVLRDVVREVGRTGVVSLTAKVDPVFVGGVTVTSATLHNAQWVRAQDLHLGDTVMVLRRGDVIPRVEAPLTALRPPGAVPYEPPTTCPKCGEGLDTESSLLWRCTTPDCSVWGRITYAASRDVLDIDGLSGGIAAALIDAGLVNDVADLFSLSVEQIASARMGTTESGAERLIGTAIAQRIHTGIEKARAEAPLARVITSLGIRKMGRTFGRRLAAHFGSMSALRAASFDDLVNSGVDGLKEGRAQYLYDGLRAYADVIDRLAAAGLQMEAEKAPAPAGGEGLPFEGKTVVVSGAVPGMSRNEANEAIERLGGKSSGSVSAKTSLLVTSETGTGKAKKAADLGVPIMDPDEFAKIVARG